MRYILLILILLPNLGMAAEPLGRLFTTPSERVNLDYLRQTKKVELPPLADQPAAVITPPALPSSISVQGYVKRSDGKQSTVWINHTPIQENSATSEVQVGKLRDGNQIQLKIPANGKKLDLKPGQVYSPETDTISENSASTEIRKPVNADGADIASANRPNKAK